MIFLFFVFSHLFFHERLPQPICNIEYQILTKNSRIIRKKYFYFWRFIDLIQTFLRFYRQDDVLVKTFGRNATIIFEYDLLQQGALKAVSQGVFCGQSGARRRRRYFFFRLFRRGETARIKASHAPPGVKARSQGAQCAPAPARGGGADAETNSIAAEAPHLPA